MTHNNVQFLLLSRNLSVCLIPSLNFSLYLYLSLFIYLSIYLSIPLAIRYVSPSLKLSVLHFIILFGPSIDR